eukprot:GCRY01003306.1.p1 GENE.GCRY01003306.1~~GCRY01003306.1.p1  ORF type:complete len:177 (+),score=20.33 GCRY01003306.1:270-800(+)
MAELHVVGQIEGASGFSCNNVFCKFGFVAGNTWRKIEGFDKGQTQVDFPEDEHFAVWSHPLDIHYYTKSIQDWPKLYFHVYSQDSFGRNDLAGYGFVHIPTAPGQYELDCVTWRPQGTMLEEMSAFFLGGTPRLRNEDLVLSSQQRFPKLKTIAAGTVHVKLNVIMMNFKKFGVSY